MPGTASAVVHVTLENFFDCAGPHEIDAIVSLSRAVDRTLRAYAPGWERPSADEAVLDTPGWVGRKAGLDWADGLRERLDDEHGLECSIGIATTSVTARTCSRLARPRGVLLWLPGYEEDLIADLPLEELDELTPTQLAQLRGQGVRTLGEMACLSTEDARASLGSHGVKLVGLVRGVRGASDRREGGRLARSVNLLTRRLARRLGSCRRKARGLELRIVFDDAVVKECYTLLPKAASEVEPIEIAARRLLETAPRRDHPIAGLALTATGLTPSVGQLSLFQPAGPREVGVQLGRIC